MSENLSFNPTTPPTTPEQHPEYSLEDSEATALYTAGLVFTSSDDESPCKNQ